MVQASIVELTRVAPASAVARSDSIKAGMAENDGLRFSTTCLTPAVHADAAAQDLRAVARSALRLLARKGDDGADLGFERGAELHRHWVIGAGFRTVTGAHRERRLGFLRLRGK